MPESVAEFLKGVWLRHLRTAVLRDGEESAGYQAALKVVDDLLWTIDGEGQRRSRSELAQRIPEMLKILTQGISDIGARAGRLPAVLRRDVPDPPAADAEAPEVRPTASGRERGRLAGAERLALGGEGPARPLPVPAIAAAEPAGGTSAPAPASVVAGAAPAARDRGRARARRVPDGVRTARPVPPADASRPDARPRAATGSGQRRAAPPRRCTGPLPAPALRRPARPPVDPDAQSASELKLRRLIDETSLADAPRRPVRMEIAPADSRAISRRANGSR